MRTDAALIFDASTNDLVERARVNHEKANSGKFVLPLVAAGMLVFAVFHVVQAQQTLPKPPPPVEPARTPFGKTVAGAGIVEAVTENIAIGTRPARRGAWKCTCRSIKVGQAIVKKGDPLFRVDDRQLKAQLEVL